MSTLEVYSLTNDDHFYYRWLYFFGKTWGDKFKQDKITFAPNVPFPHAQRLLLLAKTRDREGFSNGHCHVKEAEDRTTRAQTPRDVAEECVRRASPKVEGKAA